MSGDQSKRILFVDDDVEILDIYSSLVEDTNLRMYRALSGTEAKTMIDRIEFDCVVTDLSMPNGNGLKVRDAAREKNIPVIIVTGHMRPYQGILKQEDVVLNKPFELSELLDCIEQVTNPVKKAANG